MGDSTAMTIEFLRARLLSERAISKAAKEKADQLAKRVMELEEQVRIMAIQRRKTERAAIEAISILGTHGINDLSDAVESSSDDDENPSGEKSHEETYNDGEVHTTAKSVNTVIEDAQSSSEVEVSPSQVGSLSWKSHCKNPNSAKKLKGRQFKQSQRQINLRSSIESSPKYNLGKSFRKIKQKDMGSTSEGKGDDYVIIGDDQPELSINASGSQSSFEIIQKKEAGAIGSARDEEMERVLEQQAQLIGQYEAEEKAQREWEKKYSENKSSNQVCSEPEKQCREPEVNCESQKNSFACFEKIPYEDKEEKSDSGAPSVMKESECLSDDPVHNIPDEPDDALKGKLDKDQDAKTLEFSNGHMPTDLPRTGSASSSQACINSLIGKVGQHVAVGTVEFSNGHMPTDLPRTGSESSSQACINSLIGKVGQHVAVGQVHPSVAVSVTEACLAEVAFPAKKCTISSSFGKKNEGLIYENSESRPVNNNNIFSHTHANLSSIGKPSTANSGKEILTSELSRTQAPSCTRPHQSAGSSLGGVLESLQRAKISLKQELHRLPSLGQGTNDLPATSTYHTQGTVSGESAKVPTGSAGLFRLPNDTFSQVQNSEHKFHGSGLCFAASYPRLQYATTPGDNHHSNIPYVGAGSSNCISYHRGADLTDSIRYSLPYSGLATDRISLPNETGVAIGNRNFDTSSQKIKVPPFRLHSLPSTLMTDATPFPSRSESSVRQYFDLFHPGIEKPPPSRYSLPYSDSTRERITLHDRSSKPRTDARTRMHSQDQFLYDGNGTQYNMQIL